MNYFLKKSLNFKQNKYAKKQLKHLVLTKINNISQRKSSFILRNSIILERETNGFNFKKPFFIFILFLYFPPFTI